jgi:hypothetical protein
MTAACIDPICTRYTIEVGKGGVADRCVEFSTICGGGEGFALATLSSGTSSKREKTVGIRNATGADGRGGAGREDVATAMHGGGTFSTSYAGTFLERIWELCAVTSIG